MSVFVDTSFWCALVSTRDGNHKQAARAWKSLQEPGVTTTFVVAESTNLLMTRARPDAARRYVRRTLVARWAEVLHPEQALYDAAVAMLLRYGDKDFGLTDAISFVVMLDLGIRDALTFDAHFRQMGFRMIP